MVFRPGDTVYFKRGEKFEGAVEIRQSGAARAPITFTAYGNGPAPQFSNLRSDLLHGNGLRVNASHIIIDGLYFDRCPPNPVEGNIKKIGAVYLTTNATHDVVRNCEFTETPVGVTVCGQHNLVTSNYIHDDMRPIQPHWGPMGIVVAGSHNEISWNRVVNYCAPSAEYGHDGGAIEINDRSLPKVDIHIHHNVSLRNQGFTEFVGLVKQDHFLIDHNISDDYQSFLGLTGPCSNFRVEHNTVVRTRTHDEPDSEDVVFWLYEEGNTNINFRNNIFVYAPPKIEPVFARGQPGHSYNLFYRPDENDLGRQANHEAWVRKYLGGGARLGPGDIFGDPKFRDPAHEDFHLRPDSPAIGAATNIDGSLNLGALPAN